MSSTEREKRGHSSMRFGREERPRRSSRPDWAFYGAAMLASEMK